MTPVTSVSEDRLECGMGSRRPPESAGRAWQKDILMWPLPLCCLFSHPVMCQLCLFQCEVFAQCDFLAANAFTVFSSLSFSPYYFKGSIYGVSLASRVSYLIAHICGIVVRTFKLSNLFLWLIIFLKRGTVHFYLTLKCLKTLS